MLRLRSLTMIKLWMTTLVWLGLINSSPQLTAQSFSWELLQHDSLDFSGDGRPKRTAGGASRGQCQVQQPSNNLTALIPNTPLSLTVSPSPTFWFYVPYNLISGHSAELVLKDQQGKFIYNKKFLGKDIDSGIVGISIPSTVKLLANHNYDWHFLIYCDRQNPEKFVYVNGFVKRINDPVLGKELSQSKIWNRQEKLALYSQEKIWYDTLNILAEGLKEDPHNYNLQEEWFKLLHSIGLDHLAYKSFSLY